MSAPLELDHIHEGLAYKDGEARQLYSVDDPATTKAIFFQQCFDFSFGPLSLHACLDTSVPSVSLKATLLGVTLANCELSPDHQDCKIGGSIDGFKADVDVTFSINPLGLTLDGQLCAPIVGCDTFHKTIPL
jgi:hypothetical protein